MIVSARCPYFKSMFTSGFKESEQKKVVLEDIEFDVFLAMMRFIVSDSIDLNPQTTFNLLCHVSKVD